MAYQARRTREISEDLELVNENGEVEKVIHVQIGLDQMAEKISGKYMDLLRIQRQLPKLQTDSPEKLPGVLEEAGQMVVTLFQAVFGEEDTAAIIEFYAGRFQEMIQEVLPFVAECVIPQVRHAITERRKSAGNKYRKKARWHR